MTNLTVGSSLRASCRHHPVFLFLFGWYSKPGPTMRNRVLLLSISPYYWSIPKIRGTREREIWKKTPHIESGEGCGKGKWENFSSNKIGKKQCALLTAFPYSTLSPQSIYIKHTYIWPKKKKRHHTWARSHLLYRQTATINAFLIFLPQLICWGVGLVPHTKHT